MMKNKEYTIETSKRTKLEHPIQIKYLQSMTDRFGLVQHARLSVPFYDEGYSIDDNARALILMCQLSELCANHHQDLVDLASCYHRYTIDAWNPDANRFRNFRTADLKWIEFAGSEDSHGRALQALGHASGCSAWSGIAWRARRLFEEALPAVLEFTSPRAWAFTILGIEQYLKTSTDQCKAKEVQEVLAQRLLGLYKNVSCKGWAWFENSLTYCNAKLPHALMLSGHSLGRGDMVEASIKSLEWLAQIQASEDGLFTPIGSNGFYKYNGHRAQYDQQPIEAHASVAASLDAFRLTNDDFWMDEAIRSYQWFLGHNHLGIPICDPENGSCCDGLHPDRVNMNRGAESTLAYLMSKVDLARTNASTHDVIDSVFMAYFQENYI